MIDRRQVVYDIERCICHVPDACRDCSHYPDKNGGPIGCMEDLLSEALELLKEQEAVEPEKAFSSSGVTWWNICGNCKTAINPNDKFCHECGTPVLWEGR